MIPIVFIHPMSNNAPNNEDPEAMLDCISAIDVYVHTTETTMLAKTTIAIATSDTFQTSPVSDVIPITYTSPFRLSIL